MGCCVVAVFLLTNATILSAKILKMHDGRCLQFEKKRLTWYLWSCLTDFDKIWYGDTLLYFKQCSLTKNWKFENLMWLLAVILKIDKSWYFLNCLANFIQRFLYDDSYWASHLHKLMKYSYKKIQDGGWPLFWKMLNVISPQLFDWF